MKIYLSNVLFLLGKDRKRLPLLVFFFIAVSLLDLLGLGIVGPFLNVIFTGEINLPSGVNEFMGLPEVSQNTLIFVLGLSIFLIFLIKNILSAIISLKVIKFSQHQQVHIRQKLIKSCQAQDYVNFSKLNSANYINSVQQMVPNFANLIMFSLQAFSDIIVTLMIITFLAFTDVNLLLLMVVVSATGLFIFDRYVRRKLVSAGQNANESSANMIKHFQEALHGFKEIRVSQKEVFFEKRLVTSAQKFAESQIIGNFYSTLPKYMLELLFVLLMITFGIYSILAIVEPTSIIPTLGIFAMAAVRILPLAKNMSFALGRVRYAKDSVENLVKLIKLNRPQQLQHNHRNYGIENFEKIEFENVTFCYPGNSSETLSEVSFTVEKGQHVGIMGNSGAGKTTFVDLLLGLLTPSTGTVYFNGLDISKNSRKMWDHIAYLPQDVFLIDGNIKQNIALAQDDSEVNEINLANAIRKSQIEEYVSSLPDGVNTTVGENGSQLSGGQKQRIAIARAIYFERSILILDEATSALDIATENQIVKHLDSLKGKVTIISISHRKSSLKHCDVILNIKNGNLVK